VSKTLRFLFLALAGFIGPAVFQSPAVRADVVLYGVDFNDRLITINQTTGAGTLVGPLDSQMAAYGLGVTGSNLYAYDQIADRVRQLDPATGHTLATINIGVPDLIAEGDITYNAAGTGFLSTSGPSGIQLLSFNMAAGTNAVIGTTPFLFDGLAFDSSGVLYGMSQAVGAGVTSKLYTINTTTAALTLVGALNVPPASTNEILGGLAFAPDGTLYAELSDESTSSLYTVSKTTGQATLVGNIGDAQVSGIRFLSTSASVPEPSITILAGTGAAVLLMLRRRSSSRRKSDV
jgi:hypothetical protein